MIKKLFHSLLALALAVLTLFWLSSYTHYNTFGIDSEIRTSARNKGQKPQIENHYYRFWWPGNGSLLIGKSIILHPYDPSKTYEKFDLGAAFFRSPSDKIKAKSIWNKIGFWFIDLEQPIQQFWIGIPAGLPVFIILGYFELRRRKKRKNKQPSP